MSFGNRFREIRKDIGLNQKDMAESLGVGISTIQRYENGSSVPGGMLLVDLAQQGVNIHWLISGDGEKHYFRSPSVDPFLREIWEWLDECIKDDPGYRDWFRIQFEKKFTEFKDWKTKKRSSETQDPSYPDEKIA